MDDPRYGTNPASQSGWLSVFTALARLWRQPTDQLQPVPIARQTQLPPPDAEDWGELWSTVHW